VEFRRVLFRSINILRENITFLGHLLHVEDGEVSTNFYTLYLNIKRIILENFNYILEIITPAWEGGHHDHDATNYLIANIAEELKIKGKVLNFYTYNSQKRMTPFFNVMTPIHGALPILSYEFSLVDGIKSFAMIKNYKSQFKTFLGLSPQIFYNLIILRKISLFNGVSNYTIKPHSGLILYERRKRFSFYLLQLHIEHFKKKLAK